MKLFSSRRRRGSNSIEFALLAPVYLTVAMAAIEYGFYFGQEVILDNAARACARAAAYSARDAMESRGETEATRVIDTQYAGVLQFEFADLDYHFSRDASGSANIATCELELSEDYESLTGFPLLLLPDSLSAEATFRAEVWTGN